MTNDESKHQRAVINWARMTRIPPGGDVDPGDRIADYLFAIPNGGARSPATAAALSAEGVKSGVSDLMLPLLRQGYAGLWIELKRPAAPGKRRGAASAEQLAWIAKVRRAGYRADVCYGWEEAANVLADYLGLPPVSAGPKMPPPQYVARGA